MPRYHKYGKSYSYYSNSESDEAIQNFFGLESILASLTTFILTMVLFFNSGRITMRIEIQKDYVSSPFLSIASNDISDYSNSSLLLPSPVCFRAKYSCQMVNRNLLSSTTIDGTVLSFVYMDSMYKNLLETSVKKGEKCKEGYKQCGILDSLDNIICIKEEQQCPINRIVIDTTQSAPNDNYAYTTIKLNSSYLHYTNEAINDYIVSKFIHKEARVIDVSPFSVDENEKLEDYTYSKCYMDTTELTNFTNYKEIGNQTFIRPFIGAKPQCLPDNFYSTEDLHRNRNFNKMIAMILFIISCVQVVYTYVIVSILFAKDDLHIAIVVLPCLLYGLIIGACTGLSVYLLILRKRVNVVLMCFDEGTNFLYDTFDNESNGVAYATIIIFGGWFISSIVCGIMKVISLCNQPKREDTPRDSAVETQTIKEYN